VFSCPLQSIQAAAKGLDLFELDVPGIVAIRPTTHMQVTVVGRQAHFRLLAACTARRHFHMTGNALLRRRRRRETQV
jgi:hypothetical protein